ncbi:MAG: hypothetical protein E6I94_03820 [Chloroflexi bacterium]|nr:MAG: hypothetical protein E6I94_03820 [Chloroflexota bacterium]
MTPRQPTRRSLVLTWTTPDPDGLARRLVARGFTLEGHRLLLPSAWIGLLDATGPERLLEPRLEAEEGGGTPPPVHPNGVVDLMAIGWATVDLERALVQAASTEPSEVVPDDELLGGRAVRVGGAVPATFVLEPFTEGRLAATLARVGEGPAVLYLGGDVRRWDAAPRPGPLGPAVLVPGGSAHGPHLVLVAHVGPPGTIRP